jgi:hypothetical protein
MGPNKRASQLGIEAGTILTTAVLARLLAGFVRSEMMSLAEAEEVIDEALSTIVAPWRSRAEPLALSMKVTLKHGLDKFPSRH